MKKLIWGFLLFLIVVGAGQTLAAEFNAETGVNYNYWDSNSDDSGYQIYMPVTINGAFDAFSVKLLTSFAHTQNDPSGLQSQSLSCVIDTKVNLSYEVIDKFFADVLFGLDFNLPTGKTELDADDQQLLMDPDLVAISQFGEGFNINPTITFGKVWNNWAAGIGVGYLWRGEYDYSDTARNYDPGDVFSLTSEVAYSFSSEWQGRLFGEFAYYGKDQVDNTDYHKEGTYFLVGMGANYFQTDWDAALTVQGIFRGKSRFQEDGVAGLKTESQNSYGDEWNAELACKYYLSKVTTLRSQLFYLWYSKNDYDTDSPFYIGDTQKVSIAFAVSRQLFSYLKAECGLNGYILDQERNWYHSDDRTYRAVHCQRHVKHDVLTLKVLNPGLYQLLCCGFRCGQPTGEIRAAHGFFHSF